MRGVPGQYTASPCPEYISRGNANQLLTGRWYYQHLQRSRTRASIVKQLARIILRKINKLQVRPAQKYPLYRATPRTERDAQHRLHRPGQSVISVINPTSAKGRIPRQPANQPRFVPAGNVSVAGTLPQRSDRLPIPRPVSTLRGSMVKFGKSRPDDAALL